jgi:hypothetical protein
MPKTYFPRSLTTAISGATQKIQQTLYEILSARLDKYEKEINSFRAETTNASSNFQATTERRLTEIENALNSASLLLPKVTEVKLPVFPTEPVIVVQDTTNMPTATAKEQTDLILNFLEILQLPVTLPGKKPSPITNHGEMIAALAPIINSARDKNYNGYITEFLTKFTADGSTAKRKQACELLLTKFDFMIVGSAATTFKIFCTEVAKSGAAIADVVRAAKIATGKPV